MHLSVPVLLSLLSAVLLCGAQTQGSNTTEMVTNSTTSIPTITNGTSTTEITNSTDSQPTDSQPTVGTTPSAGLSDGAIAGITIGTLAGVGALGGGVYGMLRYTGKI